MRGKMVPTQHFKRQMRRRRVDFAQKGAWQEVTDPERVKELLALLKGKGKGKDKAKAKAKGKAKAKPRYRSSQTGEDSDDDFDPEWGGN